MKEKDSKVFDKEIWALEKVGRLVSADKKNHAIAFKKVTGTSYHTALLSITEKRFQKFMKQQYDSLFLDFYKKYGFHHGDIRPENCIIDEKGDFQLIDFGNAYPASKDKQELIAQLHKEYDRSQKEYKLDIAWAKYASVLDGKTDTRRPSQQANLRKLIKEMKKSGRTEEASNLEELLRLDTEEFLLDGSI
jgi:serine/threonine protein kinase